MYDEKHKAMGLRQATVPKPPAAMDKLKAFVSPKSVAGVLNNRKKKMEDQMKDLGI